MTICRIYRTEVTSECSLKTVLLTHPSPPFPCNFFLYSQYYMYYTLTYLALETTEIGNSTAGKLTTNCTSRRVSNRILRGEGKEDILLLSSLLSVSPLYSPLTLKYQLPFHCSCKVLIRDALISEQGLLPNPFLERREITSPPFFPQKDGNMAN